MYAGKGHDKRAKWLVSGMEEENQKSKVELTMEKGRIISVAEFLSPDELYNYTCQITHNFLFRLFYTRLL